MIPLLKPKLPPLARVEALMAESLASGKLTNFGPLYWKLVARLREINKRHDVPCTNGTASIQLCAQVTFKRGARILCPDYTHIGTLQALVAAGMKPILAPVTRTHWTLNSAIILSHKSEIDGFVVVSPFGFRVDFALYDQISKETGKPVIYDLAGGFGMKLPTTAPISFSMHATKGIGIGEGGIASFYHPDQADHAMQISCFDQNRDRSINSPYGFNLKLDEIRCALTLATLEDYDGIRARTTEIKARINAYQEALGPYCIPHGLHLGNAAPSLCVLSGLPASDIERANLGFEAKQYYPLLSDMPGLQSVPRLGVSSPWTRTCLALPTDVTEEEQQRVSQSLRDYCSKVGRRTRSNLDP